ncbi:MAG: hypothetical protein LBU39_09145 [Desulfobulbaceae bacterium]|jgi:hypothetical protein|nr:hypothetical protein [Desulfobulbaceae bacterium]
MRCPKCGYISFDHLDFCRKCNKPMASVSVVLHGSVYDCQAPVFLRFSKPEDGMDSLADPLANVVEEVEIEAPDLDVLSGLDSMAGKLAKEGKPTVAPVAAAVAGIGAVSLAKTVAPQADVPTPTPTFPGEQETTFAPAWPEEDEAATFAPVDEGMELPAGLVDISDLAPPGQEVEFTEVEGEDDFDLNLDLDLGFDLQDLHSDADETAAPPVVAASRKAAHQAAPVDMDADLDFELDLGGLSLHDYGDNRK